MPKVSVAVSNAVPINFLIRCAPFGPTLARLNLAPFSVTRRKTSPHRGLESKIAKTTPCKVEGIRRSGLSAGFLLLTSDGASADDAIPNADGAIHDATPSGDDDASRGAIPNADGAIHDANRDDDASHDDGPSALRW